MADIQIIGLKELEQKLKEGVTLNSVKRVVRKNGRELQGEVVKHAGESTFNKGYFTGNLKQNVAAQGYTEKDGGLTVEVGTTVEYGPYLEYGTRFMEKEEYIAPSLKIQEPKFKADLKKLVK
jgi:HK97 gp10 family phage protein